MPIAAPQPAAPAIWTSTGWSPTTTARPGSRPIVLNARKARTLEVNLDFLAAGKSYKAHTYYDDPGAGTRTKVGISRRAVDSKTVLSVPMSERGGVAIRISSSK